MLSISYFYPGFPMGYQKIIDDFLDKIVCKYEYDQELTDEVYDYIVNMTVNALTANGNLYPLYDMRMLANQYMHDAQAEVKIRRKIEQKSKRWDKNFICRYK